MANWLNFKKMELWESSIFPGFQYDDVTDQHISSALKNPSVLKEIDVSIDWEDDENLANNKSIRDNRKHAYRVAALVNGFMNGMLLEHPIELDTFLMGKCLSCVGNGHHRIRALQYLGLEVGPFSLSGDVEQLENLVEVAGAPCSQEHKKYFDEHLLIYNSEDIVLPA